MTMYLAAPALVAIVGCVLVSEKSDLWGLVVDSANAMAHKRLCELVEELPLQVTYGVLPR